MSLDLDGTLERFALIANISVTEAEQWSDLCEEACEEIERYLKESVDIETNSRRLSTAAASLAFYKYSLYINASGNTESFTAGELYIKTDVDSTIKLAYDVWLDAKYAISDLLEDSDFIFETIA